MSAAKKGGVVTCPCGANAETTVPDARSNYGVVARETGFTSYMTTRDGLSIVWLCPPCNKIVVAAAARIEGVFGDEAKYVYYANLFRENPPR